MESVASSLRNEFHHFSSSSSLGTPKSGTHLDAHLNGTPNGGDNSGDAGTESMFNFQGLAAMIGKDDDKEYNEDAARHIQHLNGHESVQSSNPEIKKERLTRRECGYINGRQ
jgi:hypothetical protein